MASRIGSENQESDLWATVTFLHPRSDWPGQKDNFVRTTRYTIWTFLPLTLFENFRVMTNIYFLLILIVSCLPWSPVSFVFNLAPLIFVLAVSMIKSGVEDFLKYQQDKKRNSAPLKVYKYGEWITVESKDVRAGDLVMQEGDAMVACDMLYVTSSNENQTVNYSETQLNGESAVKTMIVYPLFKEQSFPEFFHENQFKVELPAPTRDLFRFDAKLIAQDGSTHSIAVHNVLLRGMNVHYTDWIMGIALCTGHDTKVMKNMRHPPAKRTQFDVDINKMIVGVFIFKMIVIITLAGVDSMYETNGKFPYVESTVSSQGACFGIALMQYFVLYSYLIPISLMVTIEIIRLYHMFMILWDRLLLDNEYGAPEPHNSNIIGQLGIITHVLSDKTGTLTENVMELVAFVDDNGKQRARRFVKRPKDEIDKSMEFLLCLAICNTVIVYHGPDGEVEYNAESPDEAAFVSFASSCGVVLVDRQPDSMALDVNGERHKYNIISLLPFNSDRKRMTLVIQEEGHDELIVYTKGADNIMYERVKEIKFSNEVNEYAVAGLRTLVFGKRVLTQEESKSWMEEWHEASSAISGRDEAIAAIAPHVESQLECVGVSAVEDRLQPDVKEAIMWLRAANVSLWVLTGDKLETAIEIGKTSAVIGKDSDMMIVAQEKRNEIKSQLERYRDRFDEMRDPVLILTAKATELVLTELEDLFMEIALKCKSVIFSRVSPFQKASIVAMVKKHPGTMTLAIGDGANDVGMLQEAHVGVGVKGHEGSQAAQASDFAIPRFRHLIYMTAVHGHWAMNRMTHVALFMLYKNFVMILTYVWSSIDTWASPTSFYDQFLISCFNLVFTLLPPFAYGFWERDLTKKDLLKYPQLYNSVWNPMSFPKNLLYFILALWQSVCVYFIIRFGCPEDPLESNGNLCYICVVWIVAVQFFFWSRDWNGWIIAACALTLVLLFSLIVGYAYLVVDSLIGVVEYTLGGIRGWTCILFAVVGGNLPYIVLMFLIDLAKPNLARLVREREPKDKETSLDFVELMKLNPVFDGMELRDGMSPETAHKEGGDDDESTNSRKEQKDEIELEKFTSSSSEVKV